LEIRYCLPQKADFEGNIFRYGLTQDLHRLFYYFPKLVLSRIMCLCNLCFFCDQRGEKMRIVFLTFPSK
jgi:hypothetical protein